MCSWNVKKEMYCIYVQKKNKKFANNRNLIRDEETANNSRILGWEEESAVIVLCASRMQKSFLKSAKKKKEGVKLLTFFRSEDFFTFLKHSVI